MGLNVGYSSLDVPNRQFADQLDHLRELSALKRDGTLPQRFK